MYTRFCKVCLKERPARPLNWPSNKGVLVGRVCKACASELAKARYMAGMPPEALTKYLAKQERVATIPSSVRRSDSAKLYRAAQRATPEGRAKLNEISRKYKAKLRSTPEGKARDRAYSEKYKAKRLEAESNGEFKNESDILA